MTDSSPAAALDLDAVRRRYDAALVASNPATIIASSNDVPALLAELAEVTRQRDEARGEAGQLRKRVPPLMWCEGGEMTVVHDPATFFVNRQSTVEPFSIPARTSAAAKEDADLFYAWARLNEIISPDRSRFDVLRDELPKCRTRAEAEEWIRSEGFGDRYPLLPDSLS